MKSSEQASGIVGVGYEGLHLDEFLRDLVDRKVQTVVDVRLTPISRKPGFSKRALAAALEEVNIQYEHLRVLGNPKDNRAGFYGRPTEVEAARDHFRLLLQGDSVDAALNHIEQLHRDGRVALLCFEADEQRCHRHVVLERLAARRRTPAATSVHRVGL